MNLASLFSGGKDSAYAIYMAQQQGHQISCLLSIYPKSDESHLLHYPNLQWTKLQAKSMKIPQITTHTCSDKTSNELVKLENLLQTAKDMFQIEGIVHGGINSVFQKEKFEITCSKLDMSIVSPIWNVKPEQYMNDLIDNDFKFLMTSVSSDGLNDSWLGKTISRSDINNLKDLSKKFKFNLTFEGGEAETFVTDCPLFSNPIKINRANKIWDGYRGKFEIVDAKLDMYA